MSGGRRGEAERMSIDSQSNFDLSNWNTPPFNRTAFHEIDDLLPTAPIAASPSRAPDFKRSALSLDGFALPGPNGPLDWEGFLRRTYTDAVVVLKDGLVVHESYAPGNAPSTRHIVMSSTKAITGLVAGIVSGEGRLDLDAPVTSLVPEVEASVYASATLRDLLDMRCVVPDEAVARDRYYDAVGWAPAPQDRQGLHRFLAALRGAPRSHNGPFCYASCNTDLVGWALERAIGQSFADLVARTLWRPMGAEFDARMILAPDGAAMCAGGLCAAARDFARVGQLVLQDGMVGDARVLPKSLVDDLLHGGDRRAWADGAWNGFFSPLGAPIGYRNGWYAVDAAPSVLFAMGIYGQNIFVSRDARIVVAKQSSWPAPIDGELLLMTHRAFDEIVRTLTVG